jgi:hypothetical protein
VEGILFDVEQAGCPSCAALVRDALAEIATVLDVTIDERDVDELLGEASPEGHVYRIRPGSWRPGESPSP